MDDQRLFTDKYRPRRLDQVMANNLAIAKLKSFVLKQRKRTGLILHGPSGSGKTCSVYALADELGMETVEINASDYRNKDNMASIIRNAAQQRSLFDTEKLILVDEADGLSGNEDRGGVQELSRIIDDSDVPIILTVNDPWTEKLAIIRKKCELVEFNKIDHVSIFKLLKAISKREGINAAEEELVVLARKADGDLRAAINDLQALIEHGIIYSGDVNKRDKKENVHNVLKAILTGKDVKTIFSITDNSDIDHDELFLWLDENIASLYKNKNDLLNAYEMLSKADVYRGRIARQQYWRLLVYINVLLNIGVALSKDSKVYEYGKYRRTGRILKIWKAKAKNASRKAIAEKFAVASHMSVKKAMREFDYIKHMLRDKMLANHLGLSKDETAVL